MEEKTIEKILKEYKSANKTLRIHCDAMGTIITGLRSEKDDLNQKIKGLENLIEDLDFTLERYSEIKKIQAKEIINLKEKNESLEQNIIHNDIINTELNKEIEKLKDV